MKHRNSIPVGPYTFRRTAEGLRITTAKEQYDLTHAEALNLLAWLHEHRDEFYANVFDLPAWALESPPAGMVFGDGAERADRPPLSIEQARKRREQGQEGMLHPT
jgi:hypothetical protein